MKVWRVGVSDCENNSTICICATKEIALREMFKKRDAIIEEYKRVHAWWIKNHPDYQDDGYPEMINNISGDNWESWNNYPHEQPYIAEDEIIDN